MGENATKKIETEGKVQQDSAATHTHQDKHLHTAVGAHGVGNGPSAVEADVITGLLNNANERPRGGKCKKTEIKLKTKCSRIQH